MSDVIFLLNFSKFPWAVNTIDTFTYRALYIYPCSKTNPYYLVSVLLIGTSTDSVARWSTTGSKLNAIYYEVYRYNLCTRCAPKAPPLEIWALIDWLHSSGRGIRGNSIVSSPCVLIPGVVAPTPKATMNLRGESYIYYRSPRQSECSIDRWKPSLCISEGRHIQQLVFILLLSYCTAYYH